MKFRIYLQVRVGDKEVTLLLCKLAASHPRARGEGRLVCFLDYYLWLKDGLLCLD